MKKNRLLAMRWQAVFSIDILACNVDNVKRILEQLVYFSSSGYFIPQSSLHLVMTCITSLV